MKFHALIMTIELQNQDLFFLIFSQCMYVYKTNLTFWHIKSYIKLIRKTCWLGKIAYMY